MTAVSEAKIKLRKEFKSKIKQYLNESLDAESLNQSVANRIFEVVTGNNPILGVYAPLEDEVNWKVVRNDFLRRGVRLCYPKTMEGPKNLCYFLCEGDDEKIGISYERASLENEVTPDFLLIPALAFDKRGYRLGRGAGYYDRYLQKYKGLKIGIVYSCSLTEEDLPIAPHDLPVDYVITEDNIYNSLNQRGHNQRSYK